MNVSRLIAALKTVPAKVVANFPRITLPPPVATRHMPVPGFPPVDVRPLNEPGICIRMIAEVTGRPRFEVEQRLRAEHAALGTNVRQALRDQGVPCHVTSEAMDRFYATTDAFLYETLVWNRLPEKHRLRHRAITAVTQFGKQHASVLMFGDGLGFDCVAAARAGHDVTYFDVGGLSRLFAERVFALNEVSVTLCESFCDFAPESFDAIICLDVLEHVADPPHLVERLATLLKPNGLFVCHAPFAFISESVGTHLRSNARYSGRWRQLFGQAGLVPIDGEPLWNPVIFEKSDSAAPSRTFRLSRYLPWACGGFLLRLSGFWTLPYSWACRLNAERNCKHIMTCMAGPTEC